MRRAAASLAIAVAGWLPQAAFALSGHVTNISGVVVARHADGSQRILSVRSEVKEGDLLVTAENSYARVKFTDGGEVVLRPGTQVKIDAYRYEEAKPEGDGFAMSLLKGGLRSVTGALARRNPERATYATPTATIGIRGTHFGALFCADDCIQVPAPGGSPPANGLHVDVADGRIVASAIRPARRSLPSASSAMLLRARRFRRPCPRARAFARRCRSRRSSRLRRRSRQVRRPGVRHPLKLRRGWHRSRHV